MLSRVLLVALAAGADGLMFRSTAVTKQWDTWAFVENGTFYAYYLITEVSYGEGFGVATSPDGTQWTDHGYVWRGPAWLAHRWWQGSSAVWRAADFEKTGRYLINYSEMRPNGSQTITFAESLDLIHWSRPAPYNTTYFPIDTRYYSNNHGRWDTIYSVPADRPGERDGYPRIGFWTGSPLNGNGTFAIGVTDDGCGTARTCHSTARKSAQNACASARSSLRLQRRRLFKWSLPLASACQAAIGARCSHHACCHNQLARSSARLSGSHTRPASPAERGSRSSATVGRGRCSAMPPRRRTGRTRARSRTSTCSTARATSSDSCLQMCSIPRHDDKHTWSGLIRDNSSAAEPTFVPALWVAEE